MRPMYAGKNIVNNNNIGLYEILPFAKHFHILLSVVFISTYLSSIWYRVSGYV